MAVRLDLDIKYQKCRGPYRHSFDDYIPGIGEGISAPWGQRLYLRCTRCGMRRHDTFDILGNLQKRRYIPPPGYKLAKDEVPTLQELRRSVAAHVHDRESATDRRKLALAAGRKEATKVKKAVKKAPAKKKAVSR